MITTRICHSLISIMPSADELQELKEYSLFRNEAFSFQMAYRITDHSKKSIPFRIKVDAKLPINCYYTGCVPVLHADFATIEPVQPIGMYPDILIPKKVNADTVVQHSWGEELYYEVNEKILLCAYHDSWQGIWFAVNEEAQNIDPGKYEISVTLFDETNDLVGECGLCLEVLEQVLPKQQLIYTNWFHYDCLADFYRVEIFSERFFDIMEDYVRKAVKNGMNMLLMPAFTPPLDTAVGRERRTAQLVKVKVENGKYEFDFSMLKRFIKICRGAGVEYFEHSHLFTQWGAKHAPKVIAEVQGSEQRIFGWETEATGEEYISFLRAYLTELKVVLREEGLEKKILFHISDEPTMKDYENYKKAYCMISELLEGYMIGDALSEPEFADGSTVKLPIPMTSKVSEFLDKAVLLWCYYTGAIVDKGASNRLIQLPRERNRILGVQLYYHKIQGFLQWAYNYYYGKLSNGLFDPKMNPCGGFPNAGTSFMVYPADDGTAYQSVRQKIFAEGITDIRALELLEQLTDRAVCESLIETYFGQIDFFTSPDRPETLIQFRSAVNGRIKEATKSNI